MRRAAILEDDRARPLADLVRAIPDTKARRVVDLGCGAGISTAALMSRFPRAQASGIDISPAMIAAARSRTAVARFEHAAIETWRGDARQDVILANAVLHTVEEHATLLPRLLERLADGGSLAVQMLDMADEPAWALIRAVASQGPWASRLARTVREVRALADIAWYYDLLNRGGGRVQAWRTTYQRALPGGANAVIERFRDTALAPFLAGLDGAEQLTFLARYRRALCDSYPILPDGSLLIGLPRLFLVATR